MQALFEGVPAIAVSAGSFAGSYTAAYGNAANFTVDLIHQLQARQAPGQPILPAGQGLTVNVPGNPALAGAAVTTVTVESSASFPFAPTGPNTFAEGFVPNTAPSGDPTSEGSQFLNNRITLSPIDGNWGAGEAERAALASRLAAGPALAGGPLDVLLLNEDGYGAPGITATRDALLARGYNVTVVAPATDQSAVGSALFLAPVNVTRYDAANFSAAGTPATLVQLALDPRGLLNGARPDLVVVGADRGDAVGIENANHSATLGAAVTALFSYAVPSIALTAASGTEADFATAASFLTGVIGRLQATQGAAPSLLPAGVGLSINVPAGGSAANFAVTTIDQATDANLSAPGDASTARLTYGPIVASADPNSEGNAFNNGKITVSPIDGSFAVRDPALSAALAGVLGTTVGVVGRAPTTLAFVVSEDAYQGDAQFAVEVNGRQIGGAQTVTASHAAGATQTISVLDFFDPKIDSVAIRFNNDLYAGTPSTDRNLYVDRLLVNGTAYAAAQGRNDAGPQTPGGAFLYSNGALTFASIGALTLRVSEDAYRGDAQFVVRVNGVQVGGVQTATASHAAGQTQDVVIAGNFAGASSVSVEFINDLYGGTPQTDRNLFVEGLTVNNNSYGTAGADLSGTAVTSPEAVLLSQSTLTFLTQDTLIIRVSQDAYLGDAQFAVDVDGVRSGPVQTVTASHVAGNYQDITLRGAFSGADRIAITFLNDAYAGTPSTDRNLYVDRLTLNGRLFEGEAASNAAGASLPSEAVLYSNGSLTFAGLLGAR